MTMSPSRIAEYRRRNRARLFASIGVAVVFSLTIIGIPIGVVILLVEIPRASRAARYLAAEEARGVAVRSSRERAARIRTFKSL